MKITRYMLVAGLVLVSVLIATWVMRNSIIERLSGPMLANHGLEIVDVSLDALATRDASIGHIKLRHVSGTTIDIEDLLLAVRESGGRRRYAAGRVTVTAGHGGTNAEWNVAELLRQVLGLPQALPAIDVTIGALIVDPFPMAGNVVWSVFEGRQTLDLETGRAGLRLAVQRASDAHHEARLKIEPATGPAQIVTVGIADNSDEIVFSLAADVDIPVWQDFLDRSLGIRTRVNVVSGLAALEFAIGIPDDPANSTTLEGIVSPASAWSLHVGPQLRTLIELPNDIRLTARLPEATWQMTTNGANVRATLDGWPALDADLQQVSCRDGIECSMQAALSARSIDLDPITADRIELDAGLMLQVSAGVVTATAAQGAKIGATRLEVGDTAIERVNATVVSPSTLVASGSGWRLSAGSIDALIANLEMADLSASGPIFLEKVELYDGTGEVRLSAGLYLPGLPVSAPSFSLTLPDLRGTVHREEGQLAARLETSGMAEDGKIDITLNTVSGAGSLRLAGAVNSFAKRHLSKLVDLPLTEFDLTAGTVGIDAAFEWDRDAPIHGSANTRFLDLAGFYSDIAFAGISTDIGFDIDPSGEIDAKPAELSAALVDIGIPLRQITGRYRLHPKENSVDVTDLQLAAFGGTVRVDPFSLRSSDAINTLTVRVDSLDLAQLMAAQNFKAVDVTGRITGAFPVTLSDAGIRVDEGRIDGVPPGGVIRYKAAGEASESAASAVDIATKALSNFEYETLTSDVNYLENGDLVLKMQIRGRNPDMESGRPVVLNLSVENNIPEMLRSLQASRSIEDVLERRANR